MSTILIFWISFLFIEQNKTFSNSTTQTNNTTANHQPEVKITTTNPVTKWNNDTVQIKHETIKKESTKNSDTTKANYSIFNNIIKPDTTKTESQTTPVIIPTKYNIQNMEFFSQAPYGNWNEPYQDACEEASLLIWYYYIKWLNKSKTEYNKDLLDMVDLEKKTLWYFESTTITEMKQIINIRDPTIKAKIIEHPTIRDIEKEISQNNAVIAPFYGKWINNPHYSLEGPEYHFMVIKWYDQTNFITHDVWTSKWKNREYTKSTIMDNIHDRNRIDVQKWAARILILSK